MFSVLRSVDCRLGWGVGVGVGERMGGEKMFTENEGFVVFYNVRGDYSVFVDVGEIDNAMLGFRYMVIYGFCGECGCFFIVKEGRRSRRVYGFVDVVVF